VNPPSKAPTRNTQRIQPIENATPGTYTLAWDTPTTRGNKNCTTVCIEYMVKLDTSWCNKTEVSLQRDQPSCINHWYLSVTPFFSNTV